MTTTEHRTWIAGRHYTRSHLLRPARLLPLNGPLTTVCGQHARNTTPRPDLPHCQTCERTLQ